MSWMSEMELFQGLLQGEMRRLEEKRTVGIPEAKRRVETLEAKQAIKVAVV